MTTPVLIMFAYEQNKNSPCDKSNYPENIIDTKEEVDYPRDADKDKLSPHEGIIS